MVGQPRRNFMKMASWSSVSEHLVNPIGMSDQLKWNNHLLQNGVNLVYIRDFLGHTSIQTTEIYARASSKLKQKAIENAFIDIYPQEEAEWDDTSTLEWLRQFI